MTYADYSFYIADFRGRTIPAAEFDYYALKASAYLDRVTFGRISEPTAEVKNACCEVAEVYFSSAKTLTAAALSGIESEKIGDYSVDYAVPNSKTVKIPDMKLFEAAKLWLGATGLMYRGIAT